ncbi:hypothetical protein [Nocardioides alcanivorans]|uniref:hypothetical protein n=1 Tax=Nocardioides alcanivorans TaxID=2897352 RepID=UPI001F1945C2|nr:hypothetical protein [Nocardioides alcanivorans]
MWSRPAGTPRITMAGQFLLLQLTVLLVALAVASIASVRQSEADFRAQRAIPLRVTAQDLANLDVVRAEISNRPVLASLTSYAEQFRGRSGASEIHLADPEGVVLVSTDAHEVGHRLDLSESEVRGASTWTGDVHDDGSRALAAHVPVFDQGIPAGQPGGPRAPAMVGIVAVTDDYPSVTDRAGEVLPDMLRFLGLGLALGLAGAWLLSRLIKRRTRGLEPVEIAALADHREALLRSVREGVVAVGADGVVTMINDSARDLLDLAPDMGSEGSRVQDLPVGDEVLDLLTGEGSSTTGCLSSGSGCSWRTATRSARVAATSGR